MTKYLLLVLLVAAAVVVAEVPHLLNVQGLLTDDQGEPVADQPHTVTFAIYNTESGGSALWTETRSIVTVDGLFTLYLGQSNPLPASLFNSNDLWLGIAVAGESEMTPRQRLTTVPYVFRAISADTSGFAFAVANNTIGSQQIVDGSIQLSDLHQNGASTDQVIKWNGSAWTAADDETGTGDGGGWVDDGSAVRLSSSSDMVGIGVTNPQEKLHVAGDIRVGAGNDIAFGDDNTSIYETGGDLVVTANDDLHLQPDDDIYIRRDGGATWAHFDNSAERLGLGVLDPPYKLTVNGDIAVASGGEVKYHINYYQGGLNFAETGVQDRRIHISDGGNVGIGTATPGARLGVNGNLKVNGAYIGDISSSSGSDGAPFPRPAYNSGWISVANYVVLEHGIGGDHNNYVVDMQMQEATGECSYYPDNMNYTTLSNSSILVSNHFGYPVTLRVRIWVIE